MKKTLSAILSILLVMSMLCGMLGTVAFAADGENGSVSDTDHVSDKNVDAPIGIKTDKETGGYNYEVTIAVPGDGEAVKTHDEVILIIDGSYSGDDEWDQMKANIIEIGKKVLGGAGRTEMTVLTFGMGDNIVVEGIKSVAELEAMLPELPGGLLYGRSSTNCEAGFTGALKYIQNKADELNDVDVVFISDGGINTDETPRAFDDWKYYSTKFGTLEVAKDTFKEAVESGAKLPAAFTKVFGERFDGMSAKQILEAASGIKDDEFMNFAEQIWDDVYAYSGLTRGTEYPISIVERAFVKYDNENGTFIQDIFYLTTYKSSRITYENAANRTIAAAEAMVDYEVVGDLYLLRYANDGRAWWMKEVTGGNYYKADNVSSLLGSVGSMMTELSKTNYTNVVVTDYMSKWVNLDPDSIYIRNDSTNDIIWTIKDGWLSENDRPTAKNDPVIVEKVDPADYANGGADVEGNKNGDIYKLTWYVKDDCLLRTDNYSINYTVTVDTEEEGFIPGTEYPANGNTYVDYEEDGHNDIDVPNVAIPAFTVTYMNGETILQSTDALPTGSLIPSCDTPEDYTSGEYTYRFVRWDLIEGTEGDNKTVGTTDLVYLAVFEASLTETDPEESTTYDETTRVEDTTVPETEETVEEITDPEVPLAPSVPDDAEVFEEIDDPDIPLASVPQTGDTFSVWFVVSGVIACALCAVIIFSRKKEENA